MKKISIFGSTGSIGKSSVDIVCKCPKDDFAVQALVANNNYKLLAEQAKQVNAKLAVINNEALYGELKNELLGTNIKVAAGPSGISEAACMNNDLVVAGIVGAAGLRSTYDAIRNGSNIALVNKESLVCAGNLMIDAAKKHNVDIVPTDSEHSAIFQCLERQNANTVDSITITASGGPFLRFSKERLANVTPEEAINHPRWKMGPKISADCANMMNKGLEVIEAHYLFQIDAKKINILIHPESVIHSIVNYIDGSSIAQLGCADMRIPISYALYWPSRSVTPIAKKLDLAEISRLNFELPDYDRFPALKYCYEALAASPCHTIMLNASNEIALEYFLQGKIKFTQIVDIVACMLEKVEMCELNDIDEVIQFDQLCRIKTLEYLLGR